MSDSLTFRLLRYIKASAETLNFTRAAGQVFVAQSSLSHQIGKLEDNIEVLIFDRSQNGLRLTAAGRIVVAYAENTLHEWEQMLAMARAVQRNEVPPLRLGFSSFINAKLLERFREGYEGMFAGCRILLSSGDPLLCLQRLDSGTLDCAILPLPIDASLYCVHQVAQAPLVICMRSDDALADHAQLDIREVAERIWVVWENVPGVLSIDDGRTFGAFLGMLVELGYGIAYRVLDAQYFGVPQRRRRVFVVGCAGDWRAAAAVLLERHGLSG